MKLLHITLGLLFICCSFSIPSKRHLISTGDCKNSDFVSISPTSLRAGDATRITIKFRNNGTCTWKKGTVKLYAAMIYKPDRAQWTDGIKRKFGLVDDFPGYVITQDIPVNREATFTFVVDAFPSEGKYTIRYQLIRKPGVDDFFGEEKRVNFEVKK